MKLVLELILLLVIFKQQLKEKGLPWEKAKAFDGSAVIGDFLPKKDFSSLENITFELTNNGIKPFKKAIQAICCGKLMN